MAQVKVYGLRKHLDPIKRQLSDVIHSCVVDAFEYPPEKRFHRFFPLDESDFVFPDGRSERYTIVEISMFEGRSVDAKKQFYRLLYERIREHLAIQPHDVEITIFETPRYNWGIRGLPGDELHLDYQVEV